MENKDIIRMLTFHTTLNKRFGQKLSGVLEVVITVDSRNLIS